MITKHDVEQGSLEWQKLRNPLYTGMNAERLLKFGKGPYALNEAAQLFSTFWTKRGHLLETEAIEMYEDIYHVSVERVGFVTNDNYPECGYSPDGMIGESFLIEVKCFDTDKHLEIIEKGLSFEILAQVHFGMLICQLPETIVILYNPKVEPKKAFKAFHVKADPKIKKNFRDVLK